MSQPATARRPSRATKADHVGMAMHDAEVVATQQLTPHLVRITLAAETLREFRDDGPDQRFKLLLPRPGQDRPVLPEPDDWYASWQQLPTDVRPVMRTYTIRAARPEVGEVDVDVVLHEPAGPASRWAAQCRVGCRVGLYAAWAEYEVGPDVGRQLVAGDHTALPAIAAICERLPADTQADVLIEVPGPADRLTLTVPVGADVRWLDAVAHRPGQALRDAVLELPAEPGWGYAWVAADRETAAELRRHLVRSRGMASDDIMFMGYWRTDGAIDE